MGPVSSSGLLHFGENAVYLIYSVKYTHTPLYMHPVFFRRSTMPEIHLSIPHFHTKEEALYRMKRLIGDLGIRYSEQIGDVHETWTMSRARIDLTVRGAAVTGTITVEDSVVLIALEYPDVLSPVSSRMERYIRDEAEALLK